ncbi:MAG: hypothetical protein JWQ20_1216 [Conexibacter sp.]|nr:hypothetical protein [Conexibacter sp.]
MSTRRGVRAAITARWSPQLRACQALRGFGERLGTHWEGRELPAEPHGDHIMVSIFTRSATTFGGALVLARAGHAEQAAMLNRSLFEDLVDLGWCALNGDVAVQWLEDHHTHNRMLLADAAASEEAYGNAMDVPAFDPDERRRLDRKFGRYGEKPWNGKNINQKARDIEALFTEPADLENLRFFRVIVHKDNNGLLHMGASAVDQMALGRDAEWLHMRIGPSTAHLDQALVGAYWIFLQMTRIIVEHFEFPESAQRRLAKVQAGLGAMSPPPAA